MNKWYIDIILNNGKEEHFCEYNSNNDDTDEKVFSSLLGYSSNNNKHWCRFIQDGYGYGDRYVWIDMNNVVDIKIEKEV